MYLHLHEFFKTHWFLNQFQMSFLEVTNVWLEYFGSETERGLHVRQNSYKASFVAQEMRTFLQRAELQVHSSIRRCRQLKTTPCPHFSVFAFSYHTFLYEREGPRIPGQKVNVECSNISWWKVCSVLDEDGAREDRKIRKQNEGMCWEERWWLPPSLLILLPRTGEEDEDSHFKTKVMWNTGRVAIGSPNKQTQSMDPNYRCCH